MSRYHARPPVADVVDHLLHLCVMDCRCPQDIQTCPADGSCCLNSINVLISWTVIKWKVPISDGNVLSWHMFDFSVEPHQSHQQPLAPHWSTINVLGGHEWYQRLMIRLMLILAIPRSARKENFCGGSTRNMLADPTSDTT